MNILAIEQSGGTIAGTEVNSYAKGDGFLLVIRS
jgi:hypothetical protein